MKKAAIFTALILLLIPLNAFANQPPVLKSISFENGVIEEEFSSENHFYHLKLENVSVEPTLDSIDLSGKGEPFVTYMYDASNQQTGIKVTIEYDGGSEEYEFIYSNVPNYKKSSDNSLKSLECTGCEVYPTFDEKITDYKLFVPSDMTVLKLNAVTSDENASCDLVKEFSLSAEQEPEITFTVTASNGDEKEYSLRVRRLDKNTEQVKAEMASPDFTTFNVDEQIHRKPVFIISAVSTAGGLILLFIFIKIAKRLAEKD